MQRQTKAKTDLDPRPHHDASPGGGGNVSDLLGMLATTVSRAMEFPGRVGDARVFARKIAKMRDTLRYELAKSECEAATSRRLGRDFSARRAELAAEAFRDEISDLEAVGAEIESVARRLRRERRVLSYRVETLTALAEQLSDGPERARVLALLAKARACLAVSCDLETARDERRAAAAAASVYTFTRGETKHSGSAR